MSSWVGYQRDVVEYDRAARTAGESKYPIGRMLRSSPMPPKWACRFPPPCPPRVSTHCRSTPTAATPRVGAGRKLSKLLSLIWSTTLNSLRSWPGSAKADVIAYSHAMSVSALKASGDHFFGRSLQSLKSPQGSALRVLWLYFYSARDGTKREFQDAIRSSGQSALFVDDAIGWKEALEIFLRLREIRANARRIRV
ncbi:MAG: hypothetical protein V4760_11640, partial [Bdellovibrionota bacterium]